MFNTKKERYAYVQGLRAGARGKKPYSQGSKPSAQKSAPKKQPARTVRAQSFDTDDFYQAALRRSMGNLHGDFERTPTGRIKGSYTPDGFFEPD